MYPENQYSKLIEENIKKLKLINFKTFTYSPNPEVLTGEIEILTNYSKRKKSLELRKKIFQDKEDEQSIQELNKLEQLYTLGDVNFDDAFCDKPPQMTEEGLKVVNKHKTKLRSLRKGTHKRTVSTLE